MQLFAVTVGGNQLNAELGGWGFLIGPRQRLLHENLRSILWTLSSYEKKRRQRNQEEGMHRTAGLGGKAPY